MASATLSAVLPPKAADLLVKALVRADVLREPGSQVSFDELHAQLLAPAGLVDRAAALAYAQAVQKAVARAAHAGWAAPEFAAALDAAGMPRATRDAAAAAWGALRADAADAVAARSMWRPTLPAATPAGAGSGTSGVAWSVQTETANSAGTTTGGGGDSGGDGGEPSAVFEVTVTSPGGGSRVVRVEAGREALGQAIAAVSAARKEAALGGGV
jgi:hypothetical protein